MFVLFESIKIRGKEQVRMAQLVACRLADPAIPVQTLVREIVYTDYKRINFLGWGGKLVYKYHDNRSFWHYVFP